MPATRARTMMMTSAIENSPCAAISDPRPSDSCGAAPVTGQTADSSGFSQLNSVTNAISVAMPITMPGTMTAI